MLYETQIAEFANLIFTVGCVMGFWGVAANRLLGKASWLAYVIMAAFFWLLCADLAFYMGVPTLSQWPLRALVFRGIICLGVWLFIWRRTRKQQWRN